MSLRGVDVSLYEPDVRWDEVADIRTWQERMASCVMDVDGVYEPQTKTARHPLKCERGLIVSDGIVARTACKETYADRRQWPEVAGAAGVRSVSRRLGRPPIRSTSSTPDDVKRNARRAPRPCSTD